MEARTRRLTEMGQDETPRKPRPWRRWTMPTTYWGEGRSLARNRFYVALVVIGILTGVYFLNNTREGWREAAIAVALLTVTACFLRPGTTTDEARARTRRHQYRAPEREGPGAASSANDDGG